MECNETLVRCIFRNDNQIDEEKIIFHLLTNQKSLGEKIPGDNNAGTQNNESEWIWLFYVAKESVLEFMLSQCNVGHFEVIEQESFHEFVVPTLNVDQAISLQLHWNGAYESGVVSIDDIINENEELFEKLPILGTEDDLKECEETDEKNDFLTTTKLPERPLKVSPKIRSKVTTESLDSICGSSSEVEEIMSHQNSNKLHVSQPSKNSSSDIPSSSSDRILSDIPTKVAELPEEDEVFAVKETEDGLIDIDKILLGMATDNPDIQAEHVTLTSSSTEPIKSRSNIIVTKIQALFGFGFKAKHQESDEKVDNHDKIIHTEEKDEGHLEKMEEMHDESHSINKIDDIEDSLKTSEERDIEEEMFDHEIIDMEYLAEISRKPDSGKEGIIENDQKSNNNTFEGFEVNEDEEEKITDNIEKETIIRYVEEITSTMNEKDQLLGSDDDDKEKISDDVHLEECVVAGTEEAMAANHDQEIEGSVTSDRLSTILSADEEGDGNAQEPEKDGFSSSLNKNYPPMEERCDEGEISTKGKPDFEMNFTSDESMRNDDHQEDVTSTYLNDLSVNSESTDEYTDARNSVKESDKNSSDQEFGTPNADMECIKASDISDAQSDISLDACKVERSQESRNDSMTTENEQDEIGDEQSKETGLNLDFSKEMKSEIEETSFIAKESYTADLEAGKKEQIDQVLATDAQNTLLESDGHMGMQEDIYTNKECLVEGGVDDIEFTGMVIREDISQVIEGHNVSEIGDEDSQSKREDEILNYKDEYPFNKDINENIINRNLMEFELIKPDSSELDFEDVQKTSMRSLEIIFEHDNLNIGDEMHSQVIPPIAFEDINNVASINLSEEQRYVYPEEEPCPKDSLDVSELICEILQTAVIENEKIANEQAESDADFDCDLHQMLLIMDHHKYQSTSEAVAIISIAEAQEHHKKDQHEKKVTVVNINEVIDVARKDSDISSSIKDTNVSEINVSEKCSPAKESNEVLREIEPVALNIINNVSPEVCVIENLNANVAFEPFEQSLNVSDRYKSISKDSAEDINSPESTIYPSSCEVTEGKYFNKVDINMNLVDENMSIAQDLKESTENITEENREAAILAQDDQDIESTQNNLYPQTLDIESNESSVVTSLSKESLDYLIENNVDTKISYQESYTEHFPTESTNENSRTELPNERYLDEPSNERSSRNERACDNLYMGDLSASDVNLIDQLGNQCQLLSTTNDSTLSWPKTNVCGDSQSESHIPSEQYLNDSECDEFYEKKTKDKLMENSVLYDTFKTNKNDLNSISIFNSKQMESFENSKAMSLEASFSSNRDSAVVCDTDSQSLPGVGMPQDSFDDFISNHLMTTSQTADSLFLSAVSSNRQNISDSSSTEVVKGPESQDTLCVEDSNLKTEDGDNAVKPVKYSSLPVSPRSGLKRSPGLEGVSEILSKTDDELKIIQSQIYAVNDDDLFPDSLTPTKADRSLREEGHVYDFPYIDDGSNDYEENPSVINNQLRKNILRARLADCDECTISSEKETVPSSSRELIPSTVTKRPKHRNRLLRLCGCLRRNTN